MKITQKQAMDAYKVVRKLEYQDMSGSDAKKLFDMRKLLEPQFQFQDEQEHKLIEQLGCKLSEIGEIAFPDVETQQKYLDKLNEIYALDINFANEKQSLDVSAMKLNPLDIAALEPIFNIVC